MLDKISFHKHFNVLAREDTKVKDVKVKATFFLNYFKDLD